ncbi:unnamed protein product [Adineta steineri]|uniref:Uncharacterized protein n=1 Tax=Adineta steineri TaxID=433720 RepID=A0A819YDZ4_9BILA|nr:unnamed protein product [Adineta steineri]CAF4156006.1 unnamed protein product [Adineta steineri]
MATSNTINPNELLLQFTNEDFIDNMLKEFDAMLTKMNFIDRYLFSGYAQLMKDVQNFKNSLLKFVLESKIHLTILKDNFAKPRYQQASDEVKLSFIKERLDKINRATLFDYVTACQKLIKVSLDLHKEYGTTWFKMKYVTLSFLGFTTIGVIAGFSIGLVLPFLSIIEGGVGGVLCGIIGLVYGIYKLKEMMQEIEKVRENLMEINEELKKVQQQLTESYKQLGIAQEELNEQQNGTLFAGVNDLEQYVIDTYDGFNKLEQILING